MLGASIAGPRPCSTQKRNFSRNVSGGATVGEINMKTKSPRPNMGEKIRATIRRIPRGKVSTYGAVAKAAGFPRGARQVVAALRSAVGLPGQGFLGAGAA